MRWSPVLVVLCLAFASCRRDPEWYAPPEQRPPLTGPDAKPVIGRFVRMSDPNADEYFIKDIGRTLEAGSWRWVFRRPELRFVIQDRRDLRFVMDFALPGMTFSETGPVTLTLYINGEAFKKLRFAKAGQWRIEEPVPPALLKDYAVNTVAVEPDKVWISKEDSTALGFILSAVGFAK